MSLAGSLLRDLGRALRLAQLRERFILLAHGAGDHEEPEQSWSVEQVLGPQGIPNRVDDWGPDWRHDWVTWRKMLPHFLEELLPARDVADEDDAGADIEG